MAIGRRIVALISVLFLSGCLEDTGTTVVKRQELSFPTMAVQQVEMPVTYSVPGTVVSDVRIDLSSRVVGFIKKLDVREGKRVAKGDLLIQIDSAEIDEVIRRPLRPASAREDLPTRSVTWKSTRSGQVRWSPTRCYARLGRRDIPESSRQKPKPSRPHAGQRDNSPSAARGGVVLALTALRRNDDCRDTQSLRTNRGKSAVQGVRFRKQVDGSPRHACRVAHRRDSR